MSVVEVGQYKFSRTQVKPAKAVFTSVNCIWYPRRLNRSAVVAQVLSFSAWMWRTAEYSPDAAWAAGLPGVELPPHCSMSTFKATNTSTHASGLTFLQLVLEKVLLCLYSCSRVDSQQQKTLPWYIFIQQLFNIINRYIFAIGKKRFQKQFEV